MLIFSFLHFMYFDSGYRPLFRTKPYFAADTETINIYATQDYVIGF